jgi:hypothetical protein
VGVILKGLKEVEQFLLRIPVFGLQSLTGFLPIEIPKEAISEPDMRHPININEPEPSL